MAELIFGVCIIVSAVVLAVVILHDKAARLMGGWFAGLTGEGKHGRK